MRTPPEPYLLKRTAAPGATVVTVATAKAHMRVDDENSDTYISSLLEVASDTVSEMAGKALINQTWQLQLGMVSGQSRVYLPYAPIVSITSIAYYDGDDSSQSADVGDYALKGDNDTAWIEPAGTGVWPSMYDRPDALTITYLAGYGTSPANVPPNLRHAVLMLAAHWFENRETANHAAAMVKEIPFSVEALVNQSRVGWVAA